MYTIRKGVFETNSSSVHAIVMDATQGYNDSCFIPAIITTCNYGYGPEVLLTPEDRLRYLWTAIDCLDGEPASVDKWRMRLKIVLDLPADTEFVRLSDRYEIKEEHRLVAISNEIWDAIYSIQDGDSSKAIEILKTTLDHIRDESNDFVDLEWEQGWQIDHSCELDKWLQELWDDDVLLYNYIYGKGSQVYVEYDGIDFSHLNTHGSVPASKFFRAYDHPAIVAGWTDSNVELDPDYEVDDPFEINEVNGVTFYMKGN